MDPDERLLLDSPIPMDWKDIEEAEKILEDDPPRPDAVLFPTMPDTEPVTSLEDVYNAQLAAAISVSDTLNLSPATNAMEVADALQQVDPSNVSSPTPTDMSRETFGTISSLVQRSSSSPVPTKTPSETSDSPIPSPAFIDPNFLTETADQQIDKPMPSQDTNTQPPAADPVNHAEPVIPTEPSMPIAPAAPRFIGASRTHPMANMYGRSSGLSGECSDAKYAISRVTLDTITRFRTASLSWVSQEVDRASRVGGAYLVDTPLKTVTAPLPLDSELNEWALYVLVAQAGMSAYLRPVHRELVADDRGDLNHVLLSKLSVDRLNPPFPHPQNYLEGDIFVVHKLEPRLGKTPESFSTEVRTADESRPDTFWLCKDFQVLPRRITENHIAMVYGPHFGAQGRKSALLVSDLIEPAVATARQFPPDSRPPLKHSFHQVDVFHPETNPGLILSSVRPECRFIVKQRTAHANYSPKIFPGVIAIRGLPEQTQRRLLVAPNAFGSLSDDEAYQAITEAIRLGVSGAIAVEKITLDRNQYSTMLNEVSVHPRGTRIEFFLRGQSGPAPTAPWAPGTTCEITLDNSVRILAEIEQAILEDRHLRLTARVSPPFSNNPGLVSEAQILITNLVHENVRELSFLPTEDDFLTLPESSNARRILKAILGFSSIPPPSNFVAPPTQISQAIQLSDRQNKYVRALADPSIPAIVANAAFGSGKTTTVAAAALFSARIQPNVLIKQVAVSMTNAAAVAIIDAVRRLDPGRTTRVVRCISEQNLSRLPIDHHTPFNYPTIKEQTFVRYARANNDSPSRRGRRSDRLLFLKVLYYLRANDQLPSFVLPSLRNEIPKKRPIESEVEIFMKIYKPQIIVGTFASVIQHFYTSGWKSEEVATIQLDEAAQTPLYAIVALLGIFPNAKFAFVGDHRQLQPYHSNLLPERLRAMAVGKVMESLFLNHGLPSIDFGSVRRCPPVVTACCSELFYNGRLTVDATAPTSTHIQQSLGLPSLSPLQIVSHTFQHAQAGSSLSNEAEARLAVGIAEHISRLHPDASIAILAYYKAQAALVGSWLADQLFFVNTIDASQGQEFDVVIVLTTRSSPFTRSPFLEDPSRLNVALSRTRAMVVVLSNVGAARKSRLWSSLLDFTPNEAIQPVSAWPTNK